MPLDAPPPVVITASAEPSVSPQVEEVYGPIDTESPTEDECGQPASDEIVVCATVEDEEAPVDAAPPPPKTAMEQLGDALNVKIGDVEIGSIDNGDGTRSFGLRLKF